MVTSTTWLAFALVALGLAITPGPNMLYLISRSLTQGRWAGFVSLLGIVVGFVVYMLSAAFGLTAIVMAVPVAYEVLRFGGAIYLLYLAVAALRSGASPAQPRRELAVDPPARLFAMGLVNNLLNPKAAVLYLSLLPQFVDAHRGQVFLQSVTLGLSQIAISFTVNLTVVLTAGTLAGWFKGRTTWIRAQRWFMASVLATLAVRVVLDDRPR